MRLDRANTNKIPRLSSTTGYGIGIGAHSVRARVRARVGVARNRKGEEVEGRMGSLMNNFTPSAIGWSKPYGPTILGPFRSCIYPNTFRSKRVRNATASRTGTIYARGFRMWVRTRLIAEGGELNPRVEELRSSAITGLCHLSIPLFSVGIFTSLSILFIFSR